MRSLKIILLLLALNCRSVPIEEVRYIPSSTNGCSSFFGKERIACINELLKELESIKNSQPIIKVISEERISDSKIRIVKETCHSKNLCFRTEQEIYSPSFYSEIKYILLVALPSVALGIILTGI
jgi:hypothetical protein